MDELNSGNYSNDVVNFYSVSHSLIGNNYFEHYLREGIHRIQYMNKDALKKLDKYFKEETKQIRQMMENGNLFWCERFFDVLKNWHKNFMEKKYPIKDFELFGNCNHTRKEKKIGDLYRCADCGYHFCYDDQKYAHPDQYKDCEHLDKDDVFGKLTCLRC